MNEQNLEGTKMPDKNDMTEHYSSWYDKSPKSLTEVISCFPAMKFAIISDAYDKLESVHRNIPPQPFDAYELEIHAICPNFQEKGELFIRFIRAEKDFSSPYKLADECLSIEDLRSDFNQLSEDVREAYKTQKPLKLISASYRYSTFKEVDGLLKELHEND
jgi:hypothetical protein